MFQEKLSYGLPLVIPDLQVHAPAGNQVFSALSRQNPVKEQAVFTSVQGNPGFMIPHLRRQGPDDVRYDIGRVGDNHIKPVSLRDAPEHIALRENQGPLLLLCHHRKVGPPGAVAYMVRRSLKNSLLSEEEVPCVSVCHRQGLSRNIRPADDTVFSQHRQGDGDAAAAGADIQNGDIPPGIIRKNLLCENLRILPWYEHMLIHREGKSHEGSISQYLLQRNS